MTTLYIDPSLNAIMDANTPKLNPVLANGLAITHMAVADRYIDDICRAVFKGTIPDFEYHGMKYISVYEEYDQTKKKVGKNNRNIFDMAPSFLYMVKLKMSFKGEVLERYLNLPYVEEAGSICLSGSRFYISPVLSDKVIQIGLSNIFVRLLRDKLTFERMNYHFIMNGNRETVQIPWSTIYHKNKAKAIRPKVKADTTLMHYLLCKYGFEKAFELFGGGAKPVVGFEDIHQTDYPAEEWTICSSNGIRPKGCGRMAWNPPRIRIAIKNSELTPKTKQMIAAFFYIADHFPASIHIRYVNDTRMWMKIMGVILFSDQVSAGKLESDISDHIQSLDEYLDTYVIKKLADLERIDRSVTDIYQLFSVVMDNFNSWLLSAGDEVNSLYDKELSVLYYVLYEITRNIFLLYFKLKAGSKKGLTMNEVRNALNATIKPGLIHSIRRLHGEVSTQSNAGDNKALKLTSIMVPQSGSNKQNAKKDKSSISDPSKRMHVSVAEVAGYVNVTKSEPSGRNRLNLCLQLENNETIKRNLSIKPLMDEVQGKLSRR